MAALCRFFLLLAAVMLASATQGKQWVKVTMCSTPTPYDCHTNCSTYAVAQDTCVLMGDRFWLKLHCAAFQQCWTESIYRSVGCHDKAANVQHNPCNVCHAGISMSNCTNTSVTSLYPCRDAHCNYCQESWKFELNKCVHKTLVTGYQPCMNVLQEVYMHENCGGQATTWRHSTYPDCSNTMCNQDGSNCVNFQYQCFASDD